MAPDTAITLVRHDNTSLHIPNDSSKTPNLTISIAELPPTPPEYINHQSPSDHALVLNPAFITQEFDLLRLEAAAYGQLPTTGQVIPNNTPRATSEGTTEGGTTRPELKNSIEFRENVSVSPAFSTHLISSPYNNPGHYLDLSSLPTPSLLFAKALTALKPTRSDYAAAEYTAALNFPAVVAELRSQSEKSGFTWRETSFYVVVFRSRLKEGIDNDWLYKLDYESHREACESGGLLKYWFGKADEERRNLATCFWHSREDAYKGGLGPWHKKARAAGRELYERIVFSTHRFTILDGAEEFRFEDWKE
ncbi:hypothetical protein N0V83_010567 [Neocucurbitaria cava]|uniref:Uncharacterized protein n=1 Tax=Neocucurbitaria cava TaxID=798079 RepID=A0A9W9CHG6_9PLEO|nr:hypothetical protein N0V83_010567 [Neocucurbitaria cava]